MRIGSSYTIFTVLSNQISCYAFKGEIFDGLKNRRRYRMNS